jgi:hypothetical protein
LIAAMIAHDLVADGLQPVYALASEHPILIERAIAAIRDVAVPETARGFNYNVVDGKFTGAHVVALAQTLPMLAARRMVLVRELAALSASDAEPLVAYFGDPNPTTVVRPGPGDYTKVTEEPLSCASTRRRSLNVLYDPSSRLFAEEAARERSDMDCALSEAPSSAPTR